MKSYSPPPPWARSAATISIGSIGAFVAIVAIMHVLRADVDPSWRFISEYELGPYGWLMQAAFILLGLGTAVLTAAIARETRNWMGLIGVVQLGLSALGMLLAGVFVPAEGHYMHDVGAMLDMVPSAALLMTWSLSRNRTWVSSGKPSWAFAVMPLGGFLIFMMSMAVMLPRNGGRPGPTVLVGWQNRLLILTQSLWMIHLARQLVVRADDRRRVVVIEPAPEARKPARAGALVGIGTKPPDGPAGGGCV